MEHSATEFTWILLIKQKRTSSMSTCGNLLAHFKNILRQISTSIMVWSTKISTSDDLALLDGISDASGALWGCTGFSHCQSFNWKENLLAFGTKHSMIQVRLEAMCIRDISPDHLQHCSHQNLKKKKRSTKLTTSLTWFVTNWEPSRVTIHLWTKINSPRHSLMLMEIVWLI